MITKSVDSLDSNNIPFSSERWIDLLKTSESVLNDVIEYHGRLKSITREWELKATKETYDELFSDILDRLKTVFSAIKTYERDNSSYPLLKQSHIEEGKLFLDNAVKKLGTINQIISFNFIEPE